MGGASFEANAVSVDIAGVVMVRDDYGLGGQFEAKIMGVETAWGLVDGSYKMGAEAYMEKIEVGPVVRAGGWQVSVRAEGCFECVGGVIGFGRETEIFGAIGPFGGGVKIRVEKYNRENW